MRIINYCIAITVMLLISGCPRPIYRYEGTSAKKSVILENRCGDTYSYSINMIGDKELLGIDNSSNDLFSGNEYTSLPGERKIYTRLQLSKKIDQNNAKNIKYNFIINKNGKKFRTYTEAHMYSAYKDDFIRMYNTEYMVIIFCDGLDD